MCIRDRVSGGHDNFGCEFIAVLESDANSASILNDDLLHACVESDFHSERFRCAKDGAADSARAVLGKTPRAESAVNFAHVVMKQNICSARGTRTEECADDSAGGFGAFECVKLCLLYTSRCV